MATRRPSRGWPKPEGLRAVPAIPRATDSWRPTWPLVRNVAAALVALFVAYKVVTLFSGLHDRLGARNASLTGRRTVLSQQFELAEGDVGDHAFTLVQAAHVEVSLTASPRPVNVMVMTPAQWDGYQAIKGRVFGGRTACTPSLAEDGTTQWVGVGDLAAGDYRLVVERPRETRVKDATAASTIVQAVVTAR